MDREEEAQMRLKLIRESRGEIMEEVDREEEAQMRLKPNIETYPTTSVPLVDREEEAQMRLKHRLKSTPMHASASG